MICIALSIYSCEKHPGEGGQAIIQGILYSRNSNSLENKTQIPEIDERIYLIYGDQNKNSNDDQRTGYDGSFKFNYLQKGKYRLYAYSIDTTVINSKKMIPIIKEIEIKGYRQVVDISDLVIYKNADEQGGALIKGKLFAKDYNSELTELNKSYYAADEYVYLVFGNSETYNQRTKTLADGTFIFYGLRPGNYKVYAFSKDIKKQAESIAIVKEVEIENNNQQVSTSDIIIIR